MTEPADVADPGPGPADLQGSLDELMGLFRRRLLSDRAGAEREARLQNLLEGRFLEGFLNRTRLLMDRLLAEDADSSPDAAQEPRSYSFARSVFDELSEALAELGVTVIDGGGDFDPSRHNAVGRESGDVGEPSITRLVSVGFIHRGRVIVPADVIVTVPEPDPPE